MAGRIIVGTSSWADPGFVADWYPRGMPARERLAWYAERFEAVEVNSSFYAVPEQTTVARWAAVTPPEFKFDFKLHRLLSRHSAQLDSLPPELRERARTTARGRVILDERLQEDLLDATLEAVAPLAAAGKLSAFLLQLTPAFAPRRERLEQIVPLLERLAPTPVAVELRHRGWVEGEQLERTLELLGEHDAAYVCVDAPPAEHPTIMPPLDAVTSGRLSYMRLHGRDADGYLTGKTVAERFGWVYSDDELEQVAARARELAADGPDLHVLFNNNRSADAPSAAQRFRALLGQDPGPAADAAPGAQLRLA